MSVEMGKTYWKIDETTSTYETLRATLRDFGLIETNQKALGDEFAFKRVIEWETKEGLSFSTIWYINLCHIRLGEFESDLAEITFDAITGSYLPYSDHDTIDFIHRGNRVLRLGLKKGDVND